MDIFAFFDFLDQLLTQTPYATEILLGLALLSVIFLFFAVREFTYRYLKLHLLRHELSILSAEVKGLRQQLSSMNNAKSDARTSMPKDMDFVEGSRMVQSRNHVRDPLELTSPKSHSSDQSTKNLSSRTTSKARPLQPGNPPPKFPLG